MSGKNSNWLWWTLGSVAVLGIGTGAYLYIRKRNQEKEAERNAASQSPEMPPAQQQQQSQTASSPFKNKAEGDAFRNWVNDNYPAYAKEINLDRSGSHTNSYILQAWSKYGEEYSKASKSGSSSSNQSGSSSTWSTIKSQMLDQSIWAGNSRLTEDSLNKLRFGVDVDAFYDVYVNFATDGGFWIEKITGGKHGGTWSFDKGKFTVKLTDGSYEGSDANIAKLAKAAMKLKYPSEMKYYSFNNEDGGAQNFERTLKQAKKKYVDSQDSML